jgi:hypothetical protein
MRLVVLSSLGTMVLVCSSFVAACAAPLDPVGFDPADSGHHHETGSEPDAGPGGDTGFHSETGSPGEDSGASGDSFTSFDSSDPIDTGVDTGRGDPFDTGPDDTSDPCTACVDTSCASEESACTADPSCGDTITCVSSCADPTCADGCVTKYHSTTFEPFLTCIETTCGTPCGGPPPADAGPPPPTDGATDGADPCNACIDAHCATQLSDCETDTACTALMDCLSTCADPSCASACMSSHPSPKYDALNTCVESNCRTECGGP